MSAFLFLFSLSYAVIGSNKPKLPPNIEYVSYAYNAMQGNPNADNVFTDPGWNTHNLIFELKTVDNNNNTHGCLQNYTCPSGVDAVKALDCSQTAAITHKIQGSNHYHSLLAESLELSTNYNTTFSASSMFQTILKNTESASNRNVYVSSIYKCAVYQYSNSLAQTYLNISFTPTFLNDIENLPTEYGGNEDKFYDFLTNKYGTHFVARMDMGCLSGQISEMTSFHYSKFAGSNLHFDEAAQLSALREVGASSKLNTSQTNKAKDFESNTKNQNTIKFGGKQRIPDGNWTKWQEECRQNPVPINKTVLYEMSELLTKTYFPNDTSIKDKQTAMISALYNYCTEFAKRNGKKEIDCNGWPSDYALPSLSIISGFVSEVAAGWNEPNNPYTNKRSCGSGYTEMKAFGLWNPANPAQQVNVSMCIDKTYNMKDPLMYFGGMYSNGSIEIDNYFTGKRKCSNKFEDKVIMGCPKDDSHQCIEPHVCYNKSLSLSQSIIGGFFTTAEFEKNKECEKNNWYTGGKNCPGGFDKFNIGQTACGDHPGMYATLYVCLNNVYDANS